MAKLFGIDIAKTIKEALRGAGGVHEGVLTRSTTGERTPGSLTGGTNPTKATYSFEGFVDEEEALRGETLISSTRSVVSIIGASILTIPKVMDSVVINGGAYELVALVERDPASAMYTFQAIEV